jgi:hypothetical protein
MLNFKGKRTVSHSPERDENDANRKVWHAGFARGELLVCACGAECERDGDAHRRRR